MIRRGLKIGLSCLAAFVLLIVLFFAFCFPYRNSATFKKNKSVFSKYCFDTLTQKEALKDFDYAFKHLNQVHPAMLNKKGEEYKKVRAAYETERNKILQKDSTTVVELNQHMQRFFSVLGDAHSYARARYANPFYMKYLDQIRAEGYSFTELDGISFEELLQRKKDLFSYESELWAIKDLKEYVLIYEYLVFLGYDVDKGVTYTLEKIEEDGSKTTKYLTVKMEDFLTLAGYMEYNKKYREQKNQETEAPASFCSYEIDKEHNVAVLTLTSCENNAEYKKCLHQMFTEVKQNNIGNVAVDVRKNGGGSSLVINNFIKYLDTDDFYEPTYSTRLGPFLVKSGSGHKRNRRIKDLLFTGNVYILTSVSSFSSAMMFPQMIKDNGLGKVIGQAPANNPNGYGDVVNFYMPVSNIFMQISYKNFHRVNQNTTEKYVEPDYPCASDDVFEVLYEHTN